MTISVPRLWKSSQSSFASRWTFGSSSTSSSGSSVFRGRRCAAWCPNEEKWRPVSAAPISCSIIGLPSAPGRDSEPVGGSARAGKKCGWWPSIALMANSGPRWGKYGWYAMLDPCINGSLIGKLMQVQPADAVFLKSNLFNTCAGEVLHQVQCLNSLSSWIPTKYLKAKRYPLTFTAWLMFCFWQRGMKSRK